MFYKRHFNIKEKGFLQIDICRHFNVGGYIDMIFSSFSRKKTEKIICPIADFDSNMIFDLIPPWFKTNFSYFMKKAISPYSIENLILLFSFDNKFTFFHRKFTLNTQRNSSFFEAKKNALILDEQYNQIIQSKITNKILPFGKYRVAFFPRAACFLVHELFGHIFENHNLLAYFLRRGFKCPRGFNLYDDPTLQYGYGSYEFDAFFNKSQRCKCISNGVILSAFDNLNNTIRAQRVEDWEKKAEGRMSNIILNIVEQREDNVPVDLYVEDCFEGEEATFLSDFITLKTRSCLNSDKEQIRVYFRSEKFSNDFVVHFSDLSLLMRLIYS